MRSSSDKRPEFLRAAAVRVARAPASLASASARFLATAAFSAFSLASAAGFGCDSRARRRDSMLRREPSAFARLASAEATVSLRASSASTTLAWAAASVAAAPLAAAMAFEISASFALLAASRVASEALILAAACLASAMSARAAACASVSSPTTFLARCLKSGTSISGTTTSPLWGTAVRLTLMVLGKPYSMPSLVVIRRGLRVVLSAV